MFKPPWSAAAYNAAQGKACPHRGMQEGYLLNVKTGEQIPASQPGLAVHCPDCMNGFQAVLDRDEEFESLKRRLEQLELESELRRQTPE